MTLAGMCGVRQDGANTGNAYQRSVLQTTEEAMTPRTAQLEPVAASKTRWSWLQSAAEMAALYLGAWSDPAFPFAVSGPRAPRVATRSPAPAPSSIGAARSFTLTTMNRWGAAGCADDVAAVVSELLTNALRHALPPPDAARGPAQSRPIRLGLLDLGSCVLCAVADPSAQTPVPREPDWLAESGRGLQVVATLSSHWGFCVAPDLQGKVVWATFGAAPESRLSAPPAEILALAGQAWSHATGHGRPQAPSEPAPAGTLASPRRADDPLTGGCLCLEERQCRPWPAYRGAHAVTGGRGGHPLR
jgi:hypothetical protein